LGKGFVGIGRAGGAACGDCVVVRIQIVDLPDVDRSAWTTINTLLTN